MSEPSVNAMRALNRVAKWCTFFASWQLGSRLDSDGELRAVKHHLELSILMRVELRALVTLLVEKGFLTDGEWNKALEAEAGKLDKEYEEHFPGWSSSDDGMRMTFPAALVTTKTLGFPK